jgi:hypothetical protein
MNWTAQPFMKVASFRNRNTPCVWDRQDGLWSDRARLRRKPLNRTLSEHAHPFPFEIIVGRDDVEGLHHFHRLGLYRREPGNGKYLIQVFQCRPCARVQRARVLCFNAPAGAQTTRAAPQCTAAGQIDAHRVLAQSKRPLGNGHAARRLLPQRSQSWTIVLDPFKLLGQASRRCS